MKLIVNIEKRLRDFTLAANFTLTDTTLALLGASGSGKSMTLKCIAGLVLSFARALGEFGATIMFAGNIPGHTQTMSTAIYAAVQANDYDLAFRWAIVISLFSLVFIGAMNLYLKREVR